MFEENEHRQHVCNHIVWSVGKAIGLRMVCGATFILRKNDVKDQKQIIPTVVSKELTRGTTL